MICNLCQCKDDYGLSILDAVMITDHQSLPPFEVVVSIQSSYGGYLKYK